MIIFLSSIDGNIPSPYWWKYSFHVLMVIFLPPIDDNIPFLYWWVSRDPLSPILPSIPPMGLEEENHHTNQAPSPGGQDLSKLAREAFVKTVVDQVKLFSAVGTSQGSQRVKLWCQCSMSSRWNGLPTLFLSSLLRCQLAFQKQPMHHCLLRQSWKIV